MAKRALGKTGLSIEPLVFGGNVFGWTVDEKKAFQLLDAFLDYGFNAVDTSDYYPIWAPGAKGGDSEAIIGAWRRANPAKRDQLMVFTKVGLDMQGPGQKGLSKRWILEEVEHSLRRLHMDCIDLYQSHKPDDTPHEETLEAYDILIKSGKVRAIGASNYDARMLQDSYDISAQKGLPYYQSLQPLYNLCERGSFEGELQDFCIRENVGVIPYYSLASGFLSGKYRKKEDLGEGARSAGAGQYLNPKGLQILASLDEVASRHQAKQAEIALAWLMAKPGVTAPIASATSVEQVSSFRKSVDLVLSAEDIALLDAKSA